MPARARRPARAARTTRRRRRTPTLFAYVLLELDYGVLQLKLIASSMLPVPVYAATCGYGHKGRVRFTTPFAIRDAGICAGASSFSAQRSSAPRASNVLVPSPPAQSVLPGTLNRR